MNGFTANGSAKPAPLKGVLKRTQGAQKFDAIYMAILHGRRAWKHKCRVDMEPRSDHITAARCAFKISIQIAIDEKLDQIIDFLEKEEMSCSLQELEDFRSDQMTKSCF